jgi:hypothetical protein
MRGDAFAGDELFGKAQGSEGIGHADSLNAFEKRN